MGKLLPKAWTRAQIDVYGRQESANNIENELAQMFWAYKDRPLSELPEACKEYASKARKEIKDKKGIAEQDALLIRVEPKHPAPAAGGQYL